MKLKQGDIQKALAQSTFDNNPLGYVFRTQDDGSTSNIAFYRQDVIDYVNDLEAKLLKLVAKVVDTL